MSEAPSDKEQDSIRLDAITIILQSLLIQMSDTKKLSPEDIRAMRLRALQMVEPFKSSSRSNLQIRGDRVTQILSQIFDGFYGRSP